MKKILLIILIILPTIINAQNSKDSIYLKLNTKIDLLEKDFLEIKKTVKKNDTITEKTFNSISNQIGAASYNLTIFGLLFAIAALVLGIYITYIERKIVKLRNDNEELLSKAMIAKKGVDKINDQFQNKINEIYLKVRREETIHILNRLVKVPNDISNLDNQLLSRELKKEDFYILKKAYLKLKPENKETSKILKTNFNNKSSYKLLFFQHFLDLSIKDDIIGIELIEYYPNAIECAFENDMIKSTEDFIKSIVDLGIQTRSKEIESFMEGISKSEFKDNENLYEILFNSLYNRDDQFKFFNLISIDKKYRYGKSKFGELLIEKYSQTTLTSSEKNTIQEIKKIVKERQDELKPKK